MTHERAVTLADLLRRQGYEVEINEHVIDARPRSPFDAAPRRVDYTVAVTGDVGVR